MNPALSTDSNSNHTLTVMPLVPGGELPTALLCGSAHHLCHNTYPLQVRASCALSQSQWVSFSQYPAEPYSGMHEGVLEKGRWESRGHSSFGVVQIPLDAPGFPGKASIEIHVRSLQSQAAVQMSSYLSNASLWRWTFQVLTAANESGRTVPFTLTPA